jgi:tetratricopeptide (TPR) repeat protein
MVWQSLVVSAKVSGVFHLGIVTMGKSSFFRAHCLYVISLLILSACQAVPPQLVSATSLLHDTGFIDFGKIQVESQQQVFVLDEAAKDFVHSAIDSSQSSTEQIEALVHAIFDRSKLNLLYQSDANTVAMDTFHNQAANCLSMSIMTFSLATEAGFDVDFQKIIIPEIWTRRSGYSLLNGHINLQISPRPQANVYVLYDSRFQVDFDPQTARRSLPKKLVSQDAVLAMFYNNKGAEALLNKKYIEAYAYFREAVLTDPNFDSAWINLGILYRLTGYYTAAEKAYQYALVLSPDSLTAWENLAYLYAYTKRDGEAKSILARVRHLRDNNAYYHLNLGEAQLEQHNWEQALGHFRKALSLDKNQHEVYFGLARAYLQIGKLQQSKRNLRLAKHKAKNHQDQARYQSKLDVLRHL